MKKKILFNEMLGAFLSNLDISFSRLARAISVDNSLVSRWVNGKRIPSYKTSYIEEIAEYLSKNIKNSIQIKRIEDFFSSIFDEDISDLSIKEKIYKSLIESQGYSLDVKKKSKQTKPENFLEESFFDYSDITTNFSKISFTEKDGLILGKENIFRAVISSLIKAAISLKPTNPQILFTHFNSFGYRGQKELSIFKEVLIQAVKSGYEVIVIWRIDNDYIKTKRFVDFFLPFAKTKKFHVYYVKKYGVFAEEKDIFLVNGISVLTCYGLGKGDLSSFYFESKNAINLFYNYFGVLRHKYSKPLFNYTSRNIYSEYCYYMYSNKNAIGEVLIAHDDINIINFPEKTYLDIISRKDFCCKEQGVMEHYKNRLTSFERNISRYSHKEVYFEKTLKDLIKTKTMKFYCCDEIIPIKLKDSEIVSMINNIIYRLENYENYSVSIMPDKAMRGYNVIVIDNQIIFFEFVSEEGRTSSHIYSEEPMLVRTVYDDFFEFYDQIPPIHKEKNHIITYLKKQIVQLL